MRHGHNHGQANAHSIRSQEVRPNEAHRFLKVVHRYQGKDRTIRQDSIRSRQDKDHIRRRQDLIHSRQAASSIHRGDLIHSQAKIRPQQAKVHTIRPKEAKAHILRPREAKAQIIRLNPQDSIRHQEAKVHTCHHQDTIRRKGAKAKTIRPNPLDTIRPKEANLIGINAKPLSPQTHVDSVENGVV